RRRRASNLNMTIAEYRRHAARVCSWGCRTHRVRRPLPPLNSQMGNVQLRHSGRDVRTPSVAWSTTSPRHTEAAGRDRFDGSADCDPLRDELANVRFWGADSTDQRNTF